MTSFGTSAAGQISDKHQHYRHTAVQMALRSNSRQPVVGMKIRLALISFLVAVSGCGTTGTGGGPNLAIATPPAASPPSGAKVATTIIAAMDGGLIGGSIGAGLSEAEKR